nr:hypothetical protein CcurKRNrm2_p083 [Cryptomonas curvata]
MLQMCLSFNLLLNNSINSIGSFDLNSIILFNYFKSDQKINFFKFLINLYLIKTLIVKKLDLGKFECLLSFYFISQNDKYKKIGFFSFFYFFVLKLLKNCPNFLNLYFFKILSYIVIYIHDNAMIQKNFFFSCLSILDFRYLINFYRKGYNFTKIFLRFQYTGTKTDIVNKILIKIFSFTKTLSLNSYVCNIVKMARCNFGFFSRKNYRLLLFFKNQIYTKHILLNKKQKKLLFNFKKNISDIIRETLFSMFSIAKYKYKLIFKKKINFLIWINKKFKNKKKSSYLFKKFWNTLKNENLKKNNYKCNFPFFFKLKKTTKKMLVDVGIIRKQMFSHNIFYILIQKINFYVKLLDFKISDLRFENKVLIILIQNQFKFFKKFLKTWISIFYDWFSEFSHKKKKFINKLNLNFSARNFILLNYCLDIVDKFKQFDEFFILIFTHYFKTVYFTGLYVNHFFINVFCFDFTSNYNFELSYNSFNLDKFCFIFKNKSSPFSLNSKNNKIDNYINNFTFYSSVLKNFFLKNINFLFLFNYIILKILIQKDFQKFFFAKKFPKKNILKKEKTYFEIIFFGIFTRLNNLKFLLKILFHFFFNFNLLYNSKIYTSSFIFSWIDINSDIIGKCFYFNRISSIENFLNIYSILCCLPIFKDLCTSFVWNYFTFGVLFFILFTLIQVNMLTRIKKKFFKFFISSINILNKLLINLFHWKKISLSILNFSYFMYLTDSRNISKLKYQKMIISILLKSKKNLKKCYKYYWKSFFYYLQK